MQQAKDSKTMLDMGSELVRIQVEAFRSAATSQVVSEQLLQSYFELARQDNSVGEPNCFNVSNGAMRTTECGCTDR